MQISLQNMPPLPERTSRNATPEIKERILPGHQEKEKVEIGN